MLCLSAAVLFLAETAQADYVYKSAFMANSFQTNDNFGSGVTLVINGSTSLIMASGLPNIVLNPYVQISRSANNGLTWSYSQSIFCCPSAPNQQQVPFAVAFSDNGNMMLIGKPESTGPDPNALGATLYFDSNGQYVNSPLDVTTNNALSNGMSVALSGDGTWAFVGSIGVVSYTNTITAISKGLSLSPSTASPYSLATNYDGSTLVIGTGANVLVFTAFSYQSTATPTQTILPQLGETTTFGRSVSLTRSGTTLVIGSCGYGVYIYQMTNLTVPSQILLPPDSNNNFGCNVDVSDDGRKLIVGSQNELAVSNGYAYPYRGSGGYFSLENGKIAPPTFDLSYGGGGVAVVNEALDYAIVLVGGPTSATGNIGQIAVFESVPTASVSATASSFPSNTVSATASVTVTSIASFSASASSSATSTSSSTATITSTSSTTSTTTSTSSSSTTPSTQPMNALAANSTVIGVTAGVAVFGGIFGSVIGYFIIRNIRRRCKSNKPTHDSINNVSSSNKESLLGLYST